MKLSVTCNDIEAGFRTMRIPDDKLGDWKIAVERNMPIALSRGILHEGRTIRVAVLLGMDPDPDGYRIKFRPLWGRANRGCHARSTDIRIIVCEFDQGQVQFDDSGPGKCNFTVNGAGVGRDAESSAERLLAQLLVDPPQTGPVRQMVDFIRKEFAR